MSISLDKETELPISCLEPCPFNPKKPIHGAYRAGLSASLGYFGIRDRLKVWPWPKRKNVYMVINGNQRLDVIKEEKLLEIFAAKLELADAKPSEIKRLILEEEHAALVEKCRKEVFSARVPVQIVSMLTPDVPFDEEEVKMFVSTYDRNHATYDELLQAKLAEELAASSARDQKLIARMLRPEKSTVVPIAPKFVAPPVPVQDNAAGDPPAPGRPAPSGPADVPESTSEDAPWGELPELPAKPALPSLVSLT